MNVYTVGIHHTYKSVESVPDPKRRPQPLVRTTVPPGQQCQPSVKNDMELWWKALSKMAGGGQREILPPSCWRFSFLKGGPTGCHSKGWYDFRAKWKIIKPNGLQLIRNTTFQPSRYCLRNQMEMQKFCQLPLLPFFGKGWKRTWELWQVPWDALKLN